MRELIFEVTQEADGGFFAECLTDSIVTEADTWDQLRHNVKEVVRAFYFDQLDKLPTTIRLHLNCTRCGGCRTAFSGNPPISPLARTAILVC